VGAVLEDGRDITPEQLDEFLANQRKIAVARTRLDIIDKPDRLFAEQGRPKAGMTPLWRKMTPDEFATEMDLAAAEARMVDDAVAGLPELDLSLPRREADSVVSAAQRLQRRLPFETQVSKADAYRRGAKGAQSLEKMRNARIRYVKAKARKVKAESEAAKIRTQLEKDSFASMAEAIRLRSEAGVASQKLLDDIENPSTSRINAEWQPLATAVREIAAEPDLVAALGEGWSDNVVAILEGAKARGFDPVHVADMESSKVRHLVFDSLRLGKGAMDKEISAGTRSTRTGALTKAGAADRSVEAFVASFVDVMHEKHTNELVSFIENTYARPIIKAPNGQKYLPKGWKEWSPARQHFLGGDQSLETGLSRTSANLMVPDEVDNLLRRYASRTESPVLESIGKVTKPWRFLMLIASPRWLVNNFVGNVVLAATTGGVGLDLAVWKQAWQEARGKTTKIDGVKFNQKFTETPRAAGHSFISDMGKDTLIPTSMAAARRTAGVRGAASQVVHSIVRSNEVVDEFARTAVAIKAVKNGTHNIDDALTMAHRSMVDFGDLSPFERQVARSVIPFYAWQKGILKLVLRIGYENPKVYALISALTQMQEDMVRDQMQIPEGTPVPRGYLGTAKLGPMTFQTRGLSPFADALSLTTPEGIMSSVAPLVEAGIRDGLNAPSSGYADSYTYDEIGRAVPDVGMGTELADSFKGIPQATLVSNLTGKSITGAPTQGPVVGAARFAGIPVVTQDQQARLLERLRKSKAKVE
jgi:hypothetical protein